MTDDPTRPNETPQPPEPAPAPQPAPASEPGPAPEPAPAPQPAPASEPGPAPEPAPAAPALEPLTATGSPGANRVRWAIGLGVAALAIVVAIGAILVLGSRPTPEALKYIPADAAVVAEIRMDLPGDQMQKLGNLLAHFPGFLDQATLPDKIDEALSRLISSSGEAGVDYRADIKPWLSGPAFVGMRAPASGATDASSLERGLISATTTGTVTCAMPFKDQTVTHDTYRGLDLTIAGGSACAIDGHQALLGDAQSVRDALDAHAGGTGVDRSERYQAARAALQGDHLATVYLDGRAFTSLLPGAGAGIEGVPALTALAGSVPDWTIAGVRAEDDALVVDTVAAPGAAVPTAGATAGPSLLPLPPAHPSVIAPMAPADTVLFFEGQGAGIGLQNLLTQLRSMPELSAPLQMLDGIGGAGQLVGWIEDVGVAVSVHGTVPDGAVFLVTKDDATAADRVQSLSGILALASLGGQGIEVHDSTINGVAVTTITITDLSQLVPPGSVPGGGEIPQTGPISFSIAARGRAVILTSGENAMAAVLNVQPGAGLAEQAAYKQALTRSLAASRFSLYVDVRAAVTIGEAAAPPDSLAQWQANIKPYVDPIASLLFSAATDGSSGRSRFVIAVSPTQTP